MDKDFLSIHDLSPYQFSQVMDLTREIKEKPHRFRDRLKNKILAMIFEKPSLRTRMTFEAGMLQLGGEAIYLAPTDIQMGTRETTKDVGKNLERWVDAVMLRTFDHKTAVDLAQSCRIPLIKALTDLLHPCQAMADFFTLKEKRGDLVHMRLAYVGDGNNVCHSLLLAAAKTGSKISVATPPGYEPDPDIINMAVKDGQETQFEIFITTDPHDAVRNADVVYTDVWASMGKEAEKTDRTEVFTPFQVNRELMAQAKPSALFMHCLPAHRGEEVSDDIMDSSQSIVFDQAENRLHVQKAIMLLLIEQKGKNG
jgi:ornithine carbamoyltransferase